MEDENYNYLFLDKETQDDLKEKIRVKANQINLNKDDPMVLFSDLIKYFLLMQNNMFKDFLVSFQETVEDMNSNSQSYIKEINHIKNIMHYLEVSLNKLREEIKIVDSNFNQNTNSIKILLEEFNAKSSSDLDNKSNAQQQDDYY